MWVVEQVWGVRLLLGVMGSVWLCVLLGEIETCYYNLIMSGLSPPPSAPGGWFMPISRLGMY
jgi:hypothetical protein